MGLVEAAVYGVHLLFAGLWSGSVLFVTLGLLPSAVDGDVNAAPMVAVTDRLTQVSRASALLLLLTGGHLAATFYPGTALLESTRGNLVLLMVALWFVLAALVEVGASKLSDGFAEKKVREPARHARPFFLAASAVAVLLLLDAGVILGL
jgi:uncharacterized membrane protein